MLTEAVDEWPVRHSGEIIQVRNLGHLDATSFCLWSLCGWNKAGLNYLIISELSDAEIGEIGGSAPRADRLAGRAGGGCAALWNKRVPYLLLTCMPTRVQIGERVVLIVSPQRNPGAEATRHQSHTNKINT